MSKLLTVMEVSQLLQISESLIYSLVEHGRLLCFRPGMARGAIRFDYELHIKPYLESTESQEKRDDGKLPRQVITLRHLA